MHPTATPDPHVNGKGIQNERGQVFIVLRKGRCQITFFAANPGLRIYTVTYIREEISFVLPLQD
jgi:hypothetical protein